MCIAFFLNLALNVAWTGYNLSGDISGVDSAGVETALVDKGRVKTAGTKTAFS